MRLARRKLVPKGMRAIPAYRASGIGLLVGATVIVVILGLLGSRLASRGAGRGRGETALAGALDLETRGVPVLGKVPAGLPTPPGAEGVDARPRAARRMRVRVCRTDLLGRRDPGTDVPPGDRAARG